MLNLSILYLDFIGTCRGGFSAQVKKCVQYFAVVFQNSPLKNYTGETMHIVAYLKKIWKPEFRYMGTYKYFADLVLITG